MLFPRYRQVPLTQASAPQQPAWLVQGPPVQRQQFKGPSAERPFEAQRRSPQQWAPAEQAPPSLRQQFRAPSAVMPFEAQTTGPPLWEHWLLAEQIEPSARLIATAPLQTPPTQRSEPQQPAPPVQAPPALRQQLSAPSAAMPLSAQTVTPPDWEHWAVDVQV
jgi:hypothetical protein